MNSNKKMLPTHLLEMSIRSGVRLTHFHFIVELSKFSIVCTHQKVYDDLMFLMQSDVWFEKNRILQDFSVFPRNLS